MHGAIVIDYIHKRMAELGHGDRYDLRLRHFVLAAGQEVKNCFPGQLLVLMEPVEMVQIRSDDGLFDLSLANINELQYEHSGTIVMKNLQADKPAHILFIQAIPYQ